MATYQWSIPTGNTINGLTYIKDTDNKIQATMDDLVEFVNGEGAYAGQGLAYDFVKSDTTAQSIGGVKTFTGTIVASNTITGSISGNAETANKLITARTISLAGDVTGSITFDGSANKTLTATVSNDSHTHDGRYYTESEIDTKLAGKQAAGTYNTVIGTDSDINTSGATIIDNLYMTDGVITSHGTRTLTGNDLFTATKNTSYGELDLGIIKLKWGQYNGTTGSSYVSDSVTFNNAFPTACLNLQLTSYYGFNFPVIKTKSSTGFTYTMYNRSAGETVNANIYWFAIGY